MSLKAQLHPRLLTVQKHLGNTAGKPAFQSPWTMSREALDKIRASQHNIKLLLPEHTPLMQDKATGSDLKIDHAYRKKVEMGVGVGAVRP